MPTSIGPSRRDSTRRTSPARTSTDRAWIPNSWSPAGVSRPQNRPRRHPPLLGDRDGQDLSRANLNGSGRLRLLDFASSFPNVLPHGVAIDANYIYWASGDAIGRANIDGSNPDPDFIAERCTYLINDEYVTQACDPELGQEVAYLPAPQPRGITVDASHIYWTQGANAIGRAGLDGANRDLSLVTGASNAQGITVDSNYIYWANTGSDAIGRADINGSNVDQGFIRGLAVEASRLTRGCLPDNGWSCEVVACHRWSTSKLLHHNPIQRGGHRRRRPAFRTPFPPETTIKSGPPAITSDSTPTLSFSSEPGASFACRFDSDASRRAPVQAIPIRRRRLLAGGFHTLRSRQLIRPAIPIPTPASRSFALT